MLGPTGTIGVRSIEIGVRLEGVQLLMIMDARVVTCLSVAILATSIFPGTSVMVRWPVKNGWRVRIRTSRL